MHELKNEDEFFVCGQEQRPLELVERLKLQQNDPKNLRKDIMRHNGRRLTGLGSDRSLLGKLTQKIIVIL